MYVVSLDKNEHYVVCSLENYNQDESSTSLGLFRDIGHALAAASLFANILHGEFDDASKIPGYKECTRAWVDIRA